MSLISSRSEIGTGVIVPDVNRLSLFKNLDGNLTSRGIKTYHVVSIDRSPSKTASILRERGCESEELLR